MGKIGEPPVSIQVQMIGPTKHGKGQQNTEKTARDDREVGNIVRDFKSNNKGVTNTTGDFLSSDKGVRNTAKDFYATNKGVTDYHCSI